MGLLGLFSAPTPYKGQKYADLKKQAKESGELFKDPEFVPDEKALFYSGGKAAGIEWKRPKDIAADPKLFVEGVSSHDLNQGEVGNCWFVAACSCLATNKDIWSKVIPDHKEQEWKEDSPDDYNGIFHFQFWRFGEWVDVVIDDFLPTRNGKLIYVHSKSENEFWSALLEKAYAKLFGCYEALDGGELSEALEDFTGGVSEPIDIAEEGIAANEEKREALFKTMKNEMENRALMAAAIPAKSSEEMEQSIDVGLVKGHAYGITAVKRVALEGTGIFNMFNRDKLSMVRLRNPWGGTEWKGAFSDGSEEWNKIDKAEREKIGLTFEEDGEFWMSFDDYVTYFTNMSICRVMNTTFFNLQKTWHEKEYQGEWRTPGRAGGCVNNKDTYLQNPQYSFDIPDKDDEVIISLTQKEGRGGEEVKKKTIGFTLMRIEINRTTRIHQPQTIVKNSVFKNSRSVFLRDTVARGRYALIPTTFEPNEIGHYMLRIYTGDSMHAQELTEDRPAASPLNNIFCCCWCCRYPAVATRLTVIRAVGLERQDTVGGGDPYAIISCERQKIYTPVIKDTINPEWNWTVIFYRKAPSKKPIKINIWNKNNIKDTHLGRYVMTDTQETSGKNIEVLLYGRKDKQAEKREGKLFLRYEHHRKLDDI